MRPFRLGGQFMKYSISYFGNDIHSKWSRGSISDACYYFWIIFHDKKPGIIVTVVPSVFPQATSHFQKVCVFSFLSLNLQTICHTLTNVTDLYWPYKWSIHDCTLPTLAKAVKNGAPNQAQIRHPLKIQAHKRQSHRTSTLFSPAEPRVTNNR